MENQIIMSRESRPGGIEGGVGGDTPLFTPFSIMKCSIFSMLWLAVKKRYSAIHFAFYSPFLVSSVSSVAECIGVFLLTISC